MRVTRRDFVKLSAASGASAWVATNLGYTERAWAIAAREGLLDPSTQSMFVETVPNALDPGFKYRPSGSTGIHNVSIERGFHDAGLTDRRGRRLRTRIFGYGDDRGPTWPGRTVEVTSSKDPVYVRWSNELRGGGHILPVDTSLHWAYSLPGYEGHTLKRSGVPIVTHVHGGHSAFEFDGNPEFFYGPDGDVVGPAWDLVPGGYTNVYAYDVDVPAGNLWYHDHALGITRLNVYAGMAGFFFVRDSDDTGLPGNPIDVPAFPYEAAFAIQDRMFKDDGDLFYPAFPGDPFYDDFITGEGAILPPDIFPGGGPTALAEFFGDHMVVNGKIWPKMDVEPRNYRLRLLNGCDSRFLAVQFFEVPAGATDFEEPSEPIRFTVIGSDQGLASGPTSVDTLLLETGSRYDVVFDFGDVKPGSRVIMKNIGGDEPFGGDIPGPQVFDATDRVMAFDVVLPFDNTVPDVSPVDPDGPSTIAFGPLITATSRLRKVALFEGMDEFGRLQPLLGTAEPATDHAGAPINWPDEQPYIDAGLVGPIEGSVAWHSPTTENPALGATEEWEIWNVTADAHPVHLHLVHFEILGRQEIKWDSHTHEDDRVIPNDAHDEPAGDGTYLESQPVVQHNGLLGTGFRIANKTYGPAVPRPGEYVENAPKDMVTALPGQITRIKATFDKPGRYVWHCHILSHEDHEMMRVLYVEPEA